MAEPADVSGFGSLFPFYAVWNRSVVSCRSAHSPA